MRYGCTECGHGYGERPLARPRWNCTSRLRMGRGRGLRKCAHSVCLKTSGSRAPCRAVTRACALTTAPTGVRGNTGAARIASYVRRHTSTASAWWLTDSRPWVAKCRPGHLMKGQMMDNITTWDELYAAYDESLDELGDVTIGTLAYSASRVLLAVDPIAYRCDVLDWADSWGIDTDTLEGRACRG